MSIARGQRRPEPAEAVIVETPGVCGGFPRVWNTRISVGLVVEAHRQVGQSVDRTAEIFPQLTLEQIRAALSYYESHRSRVDADIASNARALEELQDR